MSGSKHHTVLLLGSNMNSPLHQLQMAISALMSRDIQVIKSSSVYMSEPWGKTDQDEFYNQALYCVTDLSPESLLDVAKEIEGEAGDRPALQWGPRPLDIDIIFFDDEMIKTDRLIIPHPLMHQRNFTLIPLLEIVPDWIHPVLDKRVETLFLESTDVSDVYILETDGEAAS